MRTSEQLELMREIDAFIQQRSDDSDIDEYVSVLASLRQTGTISQQSITKTMQGTLGTLPIIYPNLIYVKLLHATACAGFNTLFNAVMRQAFQSPYAQNLFYPAKPMPQPAHLAIWVYYAVASHNHEGLQQMQAHYPSENWQGIVDQAFLLACRYHDVNGMRALLTVENALKLKANLVSADAPVDVGADAWQLLFSKHLLDEERFTEATNTLLAAYSDADRLHLGRHVFNRQFLLDLFSQFKHGKSDRHRDLHQSARRILILLQRWCELVDQVGISQQNKIACLSSLPAAFHSSETGADAEPDAAPDAECDAPVGVIASDDQGDISQTHTSQSTQQPAQQDLSLLGVAVQTFVDVRNRYITSRYRRTFFGTSQYSDNSQFVLSKVLPECLLTPWLHQLIENGADIHSPVCRHTQRRLVHLLAGEFCPMSLAYILNQPGIEVNATDANGHTALHYAVHPCGIRATQRYAPKKEKKENAVLTLLLSHPQLDINARNAKGETAMHLACQMPGRPCAIQLLKHGADLTVRDDKQRSLLHHLLIRPTSHNGDDIRMLLAILLVEGVNANLADEDGITALHLAASALDEGAFRMLIDAGADPRQLNAAGQDCYAYATSTRQSNPRACHFIQRMQAYVFEQTRRQTRRAVPKDVPPRCCSAVPLQPIDSSANLPRADERTYLLLGRPSSR